MPHRVAEQDRLNGPAVELELPFDDGLEILLTDGVVSTQGGGIVIEDDMLTPVIAVVPAEIVDEGGDLTLELDIEGLDDIEPAVACIDLSGDDPVDIGVVVHADTDRRIRIDIGIRLAVEQCPVLVFGLAVAEGGEPSVIGSMVCVSLLHGVIEAVLEDTDTLAENGCLEDERRQVAFHIPDIIHTDHLQILDSRDLDIEDGSGAQLVEQPVIGPQMIAQVLRHFLACLTQPAHFVLHLELLTDASLDAIDDLAVHLLAVIEEPAALGADRHIRHDHHGVVETMLAEIGPDTAVSRQCLVLELFKVDELGFVDEEPVEGE